jgi:hypothetical protein
MFGGEERRFEAIPRNLDNLLVGEPEKVAQ